MSVVSASRVVYDPLMNVYGDVPETNKARKEVTEIVGASDECGAGMVSSLANLT